MPKVDLHAHLNGSIRDTTLHELMEAHGSARNASIECTISPADQRTLSECFDLFKAVHSVTTSPAVIARITREMIEDFARENTAYLEIRTTPRACAPTGMSKREYVAAVLTAIQHCAALYPHTTVRLLLSINRAYSLAEAHENVDLALELSREGGAGCAVVGVDFSGNPFAQTFGMFVPALARAREGGLKVTVHTGERVDPQEVQEILRFGPDRVGHVCFLDEENMSQLLASRIPVEICITSNIKTQSVSSPADHHLRELLIEHGHPVSLATDDRGIFATSLSQEHSIAMGTFALTRSQMLSITRDAISHAFCSERTKETVLQGVEKTAAALLS
eukprot:TRINITY_DN10261_c0_g1_i1.p1 TRINITY_DN10261_c0_g1~~TRINITY_DN10261_c0_g1_i1.p1  ORF type:complete len:348 (-),score=80.94 TRINITY_DN10261_c0_g1_i1:95-1096(-)